MGKAAAQSDSLEYRPNERATLAVCTVQSYACCRGLHLWARDLPTVIVVTGNLSSNERVRIATDDPVARDHIVRLHANARTESIIWVRLNVVRLWARLDASGSNQPHRQLRQ